MIYQDLNEAKLFGMLSFSAAQYCCRTDEHVNNVLTDTLSSSLCSLKSASNWPFVVLHVDVLSPARRASPSLDNISYEILIGLQFCNVVVHNLVQQSFFVHLSYSDSRTFRTQGHRSNEI